MKRSLALLLLLLIASAGRAQNEPGRVDFAKEIEPIFAKACYACHGPKKQRSGLRLDNRAAAFKGGDTGPAFVAGKSDASLLVRYVSGVDAETVMPPQGPRLTPAEVRLLRAWIDQGASWPEAANAAAKVETWWSLRPLVRPAVPSVRDAAFAIRNPIDAFVLARLRDKELTPSPEADRRTLIRRLYFDLVGLPPTPEDVDRFVHDPSPTAYEALVDRLLASPHYGERWARHWLDVVHYGETHGYDKDKPRPSAWPYRDYVIRAFSDDRSYRRFIEEQVAGDVLYPGTVDGIESLGFLSAGPWDYIGHAEVPETRIDGKITRHLDRDDMVSNTLGTFNSMTVSCAQCHNHKFDPISMEDYYSLHAVFAAIDRADKRYDADPAVAASRAALERRQRELEATARDLEARLTAKATPELLELERRIAAASKPTTPLRAEYGYHSALAPRDDVLKWVQVDLGTSRTIAHIVLTGCYDDFNQIGAGFGFPTRYKIEVADDAGFTKDVRTVVDRTTADVPNPGTEPQSFTLTGPPARFVRVTATRLALRKNDYIFALAELSVLDAGGNNIALGAPVTALDSIEAMPRWAKRNLTDGVANRASVTADVAELRKRRDELRAMLVDTTARRASEANAQELKDVAGALKRLPPPRVVYAGTVHNGSGNFAGTGARGSAPRPIFVLARGDVKRPGKEVGPGSLGAVRDLPARFSLPAGHREGERRAALARWLADARNPLTWRSIANRVWLYHFGRALVDSPNDFGRMGQLPSHPELLDWLAAEFRDGRQSFKELHRLMVTSTTYRQASADNSDASLIDGDNQYYWRMNRRRLEAEAIRDSVLLVAGKLDRAMGGPSFQDFVIQHPEHSPHYKYDLHDPDDPKSQRRSVYRFIVRSQQQPFLAMLDCADPSLAVEKRNQTITPQQALALLNNQLMLAMAKHFAERVAAAESDTAKQAALAFRLALGREPSTAELAPLAQYLGEHGLANACRVVMNLNEFVFVD